MFFFCGSCLLCFFQKKKKSKPSKTQIKTLPKQDNKDFSPVFSSRSFIFLACASRGMTHFGLMYMVCGRFHRLHVDIKYFQLHLFLKKIIFSLKYLGTFLENHLTMFIWLHFWSIFCSVIFV